MRKIKLKESDLRKIVQRTINESQLLTEEPICGGQADSNDACEGCIEGLRKAGVPERTGCACFGEGCARGGGSTGGRDTTAGEANTGIQIGESYRRRNYRRY